MGDGTFRISLCYLVSVITQIDLFAVVVNVMIVKIVYERSIGFDHVVTESVTRNFDGNLLLF